jgi:hypothetical protein
LPHGLDVHALGGRERVQRKLLRNGQRFVTARLHLGATQAVLGVPAAAVAGRIVALEDLWGGARTRCLFDRLADTRDTFEAAAILDRAIAERFEAAGDDYSSILVKSLSDRIAEALAEHLHAVVRRTLWGYAPDELFTPAELSTEPYRGIRPAPGYPAQPDHSEKTTIFDLLGAEERVGVSLTESYAMWPGSSVSGLYLAHPEATYFAVGRVQRDQVESYAARKGVSIEAVERFLGTTLAYNPTTEAERPS